MAELALQPILTAINSVLHDTPHPVALHEPCFLGNEWNYVKDCLDTGWVSSVGTYVDRFERLLADYTGAKHAIAVVNGTAALHICLQLAGVENGDEVLIPTLTFIATANAVRYCNAIPHFVDVEETTLGLDPVKLSDYLKEISDLRSDGCFNKQTRARIKAVIPMHTFGHPVNLDPLVELCTKYKLELIEDAAESLGSHYKDSHTGTIGKLSALSFNGNKIVTTGGGGAILTGDPSLAQRAKHITTTARVQHRWSFIHDEIGYNYRLPNINAAIGCAQLQQLPSFLERKRVLATKYFKSFSHVSGVKVFSEATFARSNYWLNTLILDDVQQSNRDKLLDFLNDAGITSRPVWTLMHRLEMFKHCPKMDVSKAENLERRIVNIPSSAILGEAHA